MTICIRINKPIRYRGPLRPLKVRSSARKASATGVNSAKPAFEEVRGVHVYSYPEAKVLSHKNQHYSCQKHTMYWEGGYT